MNKRGQFYLIAAIVIISIAVGFIIVSNSASAQQTTNIFYQKDEIKIESAKVIDYALNNQLSETQLVNDLTDFSEREINNSQNENFYFAFGDITNMTFIAYLSYSTNVGLNGQDETNAIGKNTFILNYLPNANDPFVNVSINGNNYSFVINPGENFNFILTSNAGGQSYVTTS